MFISEIKISENVFYRRDPAKYTAGVVKCGHVRLLEV